MWDLIETILAKTRVTMNNLNSDARRLATRPKLQIFWPIIVFASVLMVNLFAWFQRTTKHLFHHKTMFENIPAITLNLYVALGGDSFMPFLPASPNTQAHKGITMFFPTTIMHGTPAPTVKLSSTISDHTDTARSTRGILMRLKNNRRVTVGLPTMVMHSAPAPSVMNSAAIWNTT